MIRTIINKEPLADRDILDYVHNTPFRLTAEEYFRFKELYKKRGLKQSEAMRFAINRAIMFWEEQEEQNGNTHN